MAIKSNKILIIAPHADDEVLGCGATIAKHTSFGDEVWVIIATNAHKGAPDLFTESEIKKVRSEASRAHTILGVANTIFMDFPAPKLDVFPSFELSLAFSEIITQFRPTYLYLPHHGDIHLDHQSIYRSALVSARPQNASSITNIYCYETLSETEWSPMQGDYFFKPNHFVEVGDTMDIKIEALSCFESQLRNFPHPRSLDTVKHLLAYRGSTIGVIAAEAFEVERQIVI
jgi:N-acetylglucosamine malate deacetylase 1